MKKTALFALALGLTTLTGCESLEGTYWGDRLNDTADIVPVSFSTGRGFYAGVRCSAFVGTGIGWAETERFGWARRGLYKGEDPEDALRGYVMWPEDQWGGVLTWQRSDDPAGGAGNVGFVIPMRNTPSPAYTFDYGSAADVEVDLHLWLVGARVAVSPVEFVDWMLGFANVDFLHDDLEKQKK